MHAVLINLGDRFVDRFFVVDVDVSPRRDNGRREGRGERGSAFGTRSGFICSSTESSGGMVVNFFCKGFSGSLRILTP